MGRTQEFDLMCEWIALPNGFDCICLYIIEGKLNYAWKYKWKRPKNSTSSQRVSNPDSDIVAWSWHFEVIILILQYWKQLEFIITDDV